MPGSTSYYDADGWLRTVATDRIRRVAFVSRGRGALQGLGLGLLVGAIGGVFIGAASYDGPSFLIQSRADNAVFFALGFSLFTAPGGLLVGVARGSRKAYRLEWEPPAKEGKGAR